MFLPRSEKRRKKKGSFCHRSTTSRRQRAYFFLHRAVILHSHSFKTRKSNQTPHPPTLHSRQIKSLCNTSYAEAQARAQSDIKPATFLIFCPPSCFLRAAGKARHLRHRQENFVWINDTHNKRGDGTNGPCTIKDRRAKFICDVEARCILLHTLWKRRLRPHKRMPWIWIGTNVMRVASLCECDAAACTACYERIIAVWLFYKIKMLMERRADVEVMRKRDVVRLAARPGDTDWGQVICHELKSVRNQMTKLVRSNSALFLSNQTSLILDSPIQQQKTWNPFPFIKAIIHQSHVSSLPSNIQLHFPSEEGSHFDKKGCQKESLFKRIEKNRIA